MPLVIGTPYYIGHRHPLLRLCHETLSGCLRQLLGLFATLGGAEGTDRFLI